MAINNWLNPIATNGSGGAVSINSLNNITYTATVNAGNYELYHTNTVPLDVYGNAHIKGDVAIQGELTVQGVSLSDRLDMIEERLGILHPNEELEEKWENLRGLRNAYLELEKEIIEKEKIWSTLKK